MSSVLILLYRPRLAILNGIAAASGYLLFPCGTVWHELFAAMAGVAALAAGGSALNQVLERDIDAKMERTRGRPIPGKKISARQGAVIGALAIVTGLLLLGCLGRVPLLLGGAALAWYLAIYTPLKRYTSLALLFGAVSGAIPPMIGWCSAGGELSDYRIVLLAGTFFLWQIPHFWFLQRRHSDDYSRAGIPLFMPTGGPCRVISLCRLWLGALLVLLLLLPLFGIITPLNAIPLVTLPTILIIFMKRHESRLFAGLNLFPLLLTLAILFQR